MAEEMNRWVTGEVLVKLEGAGAIVVGRSSQFSPYSEKVASYNKGWYPSDEMARGFIEIWGMHSLLAHKTRFG